MELTYPDNLNKLGYIVYMLYYIREVEIYEESTTDSALMLASLTALLSFLIGGVTSFIFPESFDLVFQHVFEVSSIFLSGMIALELTEKSKGDVFDDNEFIVYLSAYTAFTLITIPYLNWWSFPAPRPIQLGILASFEALVGVGIVLFLEKYTEFF